jgi:hypothetical protein
MGITPYDGQIEILDRYIRVAFNVKLAKADESCLYSNFELPEMPSFRAFNLADLRATYEKFTGKKSPL